MNIIVCLNPVKLCFCGVPQGSKHKTLFFKSVNVSVSLEKLTKITDHDFLLADDLVRPRLDIYNQNQNIIGMTYLIPNRIWVVFDYLCLFL